MNKYLAAIIIGLLLISPFIMAATPSLTDRLNNLEQRVIALESKPIQPTPVVQPTPATSNFMFSGHGDTSTSTIFVNSMATITCTTSNAPGGEPVLQIVLCDPAKFNIQDMKAGEISCASWRIRSGSNVNTSTVYQPTGNYYLKVDAPAEVNWGINIR